MFGAIRITFCGGQVYKSLDSYILGGNIFTDIHKDMHLAYMRHRYIFINICIYIYHHISYISTSVCFSPIFMFIILSLFGPYCFGSLRSEVTVRGAWSAKGLELFSTFSSSFMARETWRKRSNERYPWIFSWILVEGDRWVWLSSLLRRKKMIQPTNCS